MNTNHFPFITTGTTVPAAQRVQGGDAEVQIVDRTDGNVVVHVRSNRDQFGRFWSQVSVVVSVDADRRVTGFVRSQSANTNRLGARMGFRRVADGQGCSEVA